MRFALPSLPKRLGAVLPLLATLPVIAAYAALLPGGRWQGDEYFASWLVIRWGWLALVGRLVTWSPRPVGEGLAWLYMTASNAFDQPFVGAFLGLLWMAALSGVALAGWAGRVRGPVRLSFLLFALALLLIKPGEMFYWPIAAAAYLPCWAGLAAATVLHRVDLRRHARALTGALLVAVFSTEVGAVTVLLYAALVGAVFPRRRGPLIWPALCAVVVCLIVLSQRIQPMREVMDAGSGLAGDWTASLYAALPTFALEAVGIAGLPLLAGAAIKLLLLLCLPPGEPPDEGQSPAAHAPWASVLWAGALLLGAFASLVLAYHQFGTLCCERHAAFRQGMILLALAALAGLLGGALIVPRQVVLSALLLLLLAVRAAPLLADWRDLPDVVAARQRNWASGNGPGDAMTLVTEPQGQITSSDALPAGQYRRTTNEPFGDTPFGGTPWYAWSIMARFKKHALTIAPPSD